MQRALPGDHRAIGDGRLPVRTAEIVVRCRPQRADQLVGQVAGWSDPQATVELIERTQRLVADDGEVALEDRGEHQTRRADRREPGHHRFDDRIVGHPVGLVVVVDHERQRQDVEGVHAERLIE